MKTMGFRTLVFIVIFFPIAAFSGYPESASIKKVEFSYELPEIIGTTTLSFGVEDGRLVSLSALYGDVEVQADASLLSEVSVPIWDSLNVTFEVILDDGIIEWFSFCFYEIDALLGKNPSSFVSYTIYAEKFQVKQVITEKDIIRRCEPKGAKIGLAL